MSISSYNIFLEKKKKQEKGKLADAIYRNSTTYRKHLENQLTKIDIDTKRMRRSLETNELAFRNHLSVRHKQWLKELEKYQLKMHNFVYKRWDEEAAEMQMKIERQKEREKMRLRQSSDSDGYSTASSEPNTPVQKKPLLLLAAATKTNLTQIAEAKPEINSELKVSKIELGLSKAKTSLGFNIKNVTDTKNSLTTTPVDEAKKSFKIMKPILLYRPNQINANDSDNEDKDPNSKKGKENVKFAIEDSRTTLRKLPARRKSNIEDARSNFLSARQKTFDSKIITSNTVVNTETITKLTESDIDKSFTIKSRNSFSPDKQMRINGEASLTDQSFRLRRNSILKKPPSLIRNDSVFSSSFYLERSKTNLSLMSGTDNQLAAKYNALKDDRFLNLVSSLERFVKKEREIPAELDHTTV